MSLPSRLLGDTPTGRILTWTLLAVAFGVGFLSFPANHDVAAILDLVERHLAGERLYRDVPEPNPPLIFLLSAVPALLSGVTGLSDLGLATTSFVVTELLALLLAGRIAMRGWPAEHRHAVAILVFVSVFAWSNMHIGQREHLWFAWSLPWLALVEARAEGRAPSRGVSIAAGVFAALGFALKPYFLPVALVAEGWLTWRRGLRPLRLENTVLIASAALYTGVVVASGYLPNAAAFRQFYGAFDVDPAMMFALSRVEVWGPLGLAVLVVPVSAERRPLKRLLVALVLAWAGSAILQQKGWRYHWYPLWAGVALAFALLVRTMRMGPLAILAVALVGLWDAHRMTTMRWHALGADVVIDLSERMKRYAADGRILYLSADAYPTFPSVRMAGAHLVNRAPLMFVPGLYVGVDPKASPFPFHAPPSEVEQRVIAAITDDLLRTRPSLVVVDERPIKEGFGETTFDWLDFAARDPRWEEAFSGWRKVRGAWQTAMYLRNDLADPYEN